MKNKILTLTAIGLASVSVASAQTIAKWTFEINTPADLNNTASIGSIAADTGTGMASGVHANAATDWTTPVGNGSANSLSANEWTLGDYFQFSVSTIGYMDIMLAWAQTSSSTGPGEFKLAYQVNGGGFTDYLNYTVLPNQAASPGLGSWTSSSEITGYNFSVDLSSLIVLDQATSVDFRLIMRSTADSTPPGTVAAAGSSRVDNFTITATTVPEPTPFVVGGLAMLLVASRWRQQRI